MAKNVQKRLKPPTFYKVSSDDSIVHSSWLILPIIIMVIMIEKPKYKTEKSWQMTEMRSEEIFWAAPLSGWLSLTKYYRRKTLQQHNLKRRIVLESVFSGRELTFVNAYIFTCFPDNKMFGSPFSMDGHQVKHLKEVWESVFSGWESETFLWPMRQINKGPNFSGWESTVVNSLEFPPIFLTKSKLRCLGVGFQWMGIMTFLGFCLCYCNFPEKKSKLRCLGVSFQWMGICDFPT